MNSFQPRLGAVACLLLVLGASACKSVDGRYEDANGTISLTLKGSKAQFSAMGDVEECTAKVAGKEVVLTCPGLDGVVTLKMNDDGSFSGPFGVLTRRSS